jgi:hypothetical protein
VGQVALDEQILALLGPKTAEDEKKPEKKKVKPAKAPKEVGEPYNRRESIKLNNEAACRFTADRLLQSQVSMLLQCDVNMMQDGTILRLATKLSDFGSECERQK